MTPKGFPGTVSDGIIAAFRENHSFIQITAPIYRAWREYAMLRDQSRILVFGLTRRGNNRTAAQN